MRFIFLVLPFLLAGCLSDTRYVDETVDVTQNMTLTEDVLKTKFRFTTPNVVLDGGGHTIDGNCNTECIGFAIAADNVVIRNVTLKQFDGGVSITHGASGVRFENVTITDNVQHGIFVDKDSSNFVCSKCNITDNGAMGIYFEYNTHGNTVEDSEISFNGFRDKDTGDFIENQKNKKKDKREGIAIDSSQGNLILNTDFFGNALADVTIYRNCGERGIRREWSANFNTINGGHFSGDILVASRQDKDLSTWDCLEPYVHNGKFVTDDAEFNVIENVTLGANAKIVISDDNNSVSGVNGGQLIVGSAVRDALNLPITGVAIRNTTSSYSGNPSFVVE